MSHTLRDVLRTILFGSVGAGLVSGCCYGPFCNLEVPPSSADHAVALAEMEGLTIHLPFGAGIRAQCRQENLLALAIPNYFGREILAPIGGVAYPHFARREGDDDDSATDFGNHINLDQGDGTMVVIGNLKEFFVENGQAVVAGQLIGLAVSANQGASSQVQLGWQAGDATVTALDSSSLEGLRLIVAVAQADDADDADGTVLGEQTLGVEELTCGQPGGGYYTSALSASVP